MGYIVKTIAAVNQEVNLAFDVELCDNNIVKTVVGICPGCMSVVSAKKKSLFFTCEDCEENVPLRQAVANLKEMCQDPALVNDVIELCLTLEDSVDSEIPLEIITLLKESHPYNEQVFYTYVRMSGYDIDAIREYLHTFAEVKGEKPFAHDLLENMIQPQNMTMHALIAKYITNKTKGAKQKEYLERLSTIKEDYTKGLGLGEGIFSMYAIYVIASAVNIAMVAFLIIIDFERFALLFNTLIALGVLAIEIGILFVHNKIYGNRLGMSSIELVLLSLFLSTIAAVIAGVIIGAMV